MHRHLIQFVAALALTALIPPAVSLAGDEAPGLMDPATQAPGLSVGEQAPALALVDGEGKAVDLASLYANGPVVITFYRGGWCPFCTKALKDWEDAVDAVRDAGGTFVAVTPEAPEHASNTRQKHAPSLTILSDADGSGARAFRVAFELESALQQKYKGFGVDLAQRNGSGRWELPAPATFVIGRDGVVRWAFADWDYKKRADPQSVIAAVRDAAAQ